METGSKRALFPYLDACRSRYREAELKSAVSWLHLPASAAHRLNGLADCIDHELGLLLVDVVAAVSCWLGRHFIDATWWFDFTLSTQASAL
jgi:hypothetical protein